MHKEPSEIGPKQRTCGVKVSTSWRLTLCIGSGRQGAIPYWAGYIRRRGLVSSALPAPFCRLLPGLIPVVFAAHIAYVTSLRSTGGNGMAHSAAVAIVLGRPRPTSRPGVPRFDPAFRCFCRLAPADRRPGFIVVLLVAAGLAEAQCSQRDPRSAVRLCQAPPPAIGPTTTAPAPPPERTPTISLFAPLGLGSRKATAAQRCPAYVL